MTSEAGKLLTVREVSRILGVEMGAVYTYINEKSLKAVKLGGNGKSKHHWRIKQSDLDSFVNGD